MKGLLVFFLALSVYAGSPANPDSSDPYERIGATRQMSGSELRRAFLFALNRFNPALNADATEEQFERIKEAGVALFGEPPAAPKDSSPVEGTESIQEARFKKSLELVAKQYEELKQYIPPRAPFSDADVAWHLRTLHNELEVVRQDFMFLMGRMRAPTYADILAAFERVKNYNHGQGLPIMRLSPELRTRVFDMFVEDAVSLVKHAPTADEAKKVAEYVSEPMGRVNVFMRAMGRGGSGRHIAEMLSQALNLEGIETVSVSTRRALVHAALAGSTKDLSVTPAQYLKGYLSKFVLSRLEAPYNRAQILRVLEPVLAYELDLEILQLVSDISRAEWLSFDVTGTASKMIKMWARLEVTNNPQVHKALKETAAAELPPLKTPAGICARILTKRALDWLF